VQSGARPKKGLSQHFLRDGNIADKIITSLDLQPGDEVLEIGAGEGVLTERLLQSPASSVTAVEIDHTLAVWLGVLFGKNPGFRLIEGDILRQKMDRLSEGAKMRVAGNLPYSITSPILFYLLENRIYVEDAVVMIQKEVAERLTSPAGNRTYGIPSVFLQLYANMEVLFHVKAAAFYPRPAVTSSVMRMVFYPEPKYRVTDEIFFRRVVKTAFRQRRKMLRNTLKPILKHIPGRSGIQTDLDLRPEQLTVEEWARLCNDLRELLPEGNYGKS